MHTKENEYCTNVSNKLLKNYNQKYTSIHVMFKCPKKCLRYGISYKK
jgi:hypothetical protein